MLGTTSKSKRISHSTSHAEILATACGLPMGQLLAIRYSEDDLVRLICGRITPMRFLQLPRRWSGSYADGPDDRLHGLLGTLHRLPRSTPRQKSSLSNPSITRRAETTTTPATLPRTYSMGVVRHVDKVPWMRFLVFASTFNLWTLDH